MHNNALLAALHAETFDSIREQPAAWGHIVESAIGAFLLNSAVSAGFSIYFWRERDKEVDFVLERRGKLVAIEVKSNGIVHKTGIETFRSQYPSSRIVAVGKTGLPWQEFLSINPVTLF